MEYSSDEFVFFKNCLAKAIKKTLFLSVKWSDCLINFNNETYIQLKGTVPLNKKIFPWQKTSEESFFIYINPKNKKVLINKYLGNKNYITDEFSLSPMTVSGDNHTLNETLFRGGPITHKKLFTHLSKRNSGLNKTFNLLYKNILKTIPSEFSKTFSESLVFKSLTKIPGVYFKKYTFQNVEKIIENNEIRLKLKFSVQGSSEETFNLVLNKDLSSTSSKFYFYNELLGKITDIKKESYFSSTLIKEIKRTISYLEQNQDFRFNQIPTVFAIEDKENKNFQSILEAFNCWSANQTKPPEDFSFSLNSNSGEEMALIEKNAQISFLIQEIKKRLQKEEFFKSQFDKLWVNGESFKSYPLIESQKELLENNMNMQKSLLKTLINYQFEISKKIVESLKDQAS